MVSSELQAELQRVGFSKCMGVSDLFFSCGIGIYVDLISVLFQKRAEPCPPPIIPYKHQAKRGRLAPPVVALRRHRHCCWVSQHIDRVLVPRRSTMLVFRPSPRLLQLAASRVAGSAPALTHRAPHAPTGTFGLGSWRSFSGDRRRIAEADGCADGRSGAALAVHATQQDAAAQVARAGRQPVAGRRVQAAALPAGTQQELPGARAAPR
jgi:hypothetical protein